MPLARGSSKKVIGQNVREMMASGHSQKQSVAAALRMAGVPKSSGSGRSKGGSKRKK